MWGEPERAMQNNILWLTKASPVLIPGYSTGSQATSWLAKLVYNIHHLKDTLWIFGLYHFSFSLAEWFSRISMEGSFLDAFGSVQRFATKICTISWNTNYQYRLDKLHLWLSLAEWFSRIVFTTLQLKLMPWALKKYAIFMIMIIHMTKIKNLNTKGLRSIQISRGSD